MSGTFAEKLLTIAENTPKVFEVGKKGIEADIAPIKIVSLAFQEKLQTIADNVIRVYEAGRDASGGYQQVEYIESTGTQYIATDYIPNNNTRTVCDFQIVTPSATFIFGVRKTTSTLAWTLNQSSGSSPVWYTSYNNSGNTNLGKLDTQRHVIDKNKNEIYIDGVLKRTFTEEDFTCEKPLSIFACNFNSVAGYGCSSIKLFSFKIYDNDVLVRDYIPCYRKSDNVAGLYDLVNETFLENAGSDSFIYGQNIWDEQWENGVYSTTTGWIVPNSSFICSKNDSPIEVYADTEYYFIAPQRLYVMFYDENLNFISYKGAMNEVLTTPTNCKYIKFYVHSNYGTTYLNDIRVCLPSDSNIVSTDFQDGIYTCSGYVGETVNVTCALKANTDYTVSFDYEFVSLESDYGYDNLSLFISTGNVIKYYPADIGKGTMAATFSLTKDVESLPIIFINPNNSAEAEISITNFQIIRGAETTTTAQTTE